MKYIIYNNIKSIYQTVWLYIKAGLPTAKFCRPDTKIAPILWRFFIFAIQKDQLITLWVTAFILGS